MFKPYLNIPSVTQAIMVGLFWKSAPNDRREKTFSVFQPSHIIIIKITLGLTPDPDLFHTAKVLKWEGRKTVMYGLGFFPDPFP